MWGAYGTELGHMIETKGLAPGRFHTGVGAL